MDVLKDLDSDLTYIPEMPKFTQINPPPYAQPRIEFGKLLPKKKDDKKKKVKKAKLKLPKLKKGEKPPHIYPYSEYPP